MGRETQHKERYSSRKLSEEEEGKEKWPWDTRGRRTQVVRQEGLHIATASERNERRSKRERNNNERNITC